MIEVVFDDILRQDVDVIVNPAGEGMLHAGGLASTIAEAAGPELVEQSRLLAPVRTGEAIITTAGDLPFKGVIHAVGPRWDEGHEAELLAQAHAAAFRLAETLDYQSIALPAISCGIFGCPSELAAPIALRVAKQWEPKFERIVFCLLDDEHYDHFKAAL